MSPKELNLEDARQETVCFGKTTIPFSVEFRPRKHMGITVHPDLRVHVAAPIGTDMEEVRRRVLKRAPWILKQLHWFNRFRPIPTPRQYLNGETHWYLGKRYRLKILKDDPTGVKLRGAFLEVATDFPKDNEKVRALVKTWYREHARALFQRRMDVCRALVPGLKQANPPLLVRKLQGRWGSCSKEGRILLNVELVRAPVACIDYVVIHELCHLKVRKHSPEFYRLLSKVMPDWEQKKAKLEHFQF